MHRGIMAVCLLAMAAQMASSPCIADTSILTLDGAVQHALAVEDPSWRQFEERARALQERGIADSQLPDPMLRGDLSNMPVDSFSLDQEPMTQIRVGLRQDFPAGDTLSVNKQRRERESEVELAKKDLTLRDIKLTIRKAWLDLFYALHAQELVRQSRDAVTQLGHMLEASYRAGTTTSADILRTETEIALFEDKLALFEKNEAVARATLARYIGMTRADDALSPTLPELAAMPDMDTARQALLHHPLTRIADARLGVEQADINLAEEAYAPNFGLEAGYGVRKGSRPDFASIGVTLSVPLFTHNRQDKHLSAARREHAASKLERATVLRDLNRELETSYATLVSLQKREALYKQLIVTRSAEAREATTHAYSGRQADFNDVITSHLLQLDVELKELEISVEQAKAHSALQYLAGDFR